MKIVFFGMGSIGSRHAELIHKKFNHELYALRSGKSNAKLPKYVTALNSWTEVKKINPEIAFITNPTSLHIETAIKCANLGYKIFIDKPIGDKKKNLNELIKIIKNKQLVTYIGYNMRFHPVILELQKYIKRKDFLHMNINTTSYLPNWRKGTDHKKSYRSNKKMGGGIILDMSHEFDYINYLLGDIEIINGNFSKRSNLTNDVEDFMDVLIKTPKGPVSLHVNFFSHFRQRLIQIDFEDITILGDILNSTVEVYKKEKLVSKKSFNSERNFSFENQLDYFFKNIDNPKMMNNLIDASKLFGKIIKFKESHD